MVDCVDLATRCGFPVVERYELGEGELLHEALGWVSAFDEAWWRAWELSDVGC